ncbi:MAG: hypothetical protein HY925_10945 [Elusimicrobia bacterium]|nr:hypothetical protein [Elusimicrobiota bacterium]
MDSYRLVFARDAEAEFRRVPFPFRRQLNGRLHLLKREPRPSEAVRIAESESYWLPSGDWIVLYEVDDEQRRLTVFGVVRYSPEA